MINKEELQYKTREELIELVLELSKGVDIQKTIKEGIKEGLMYSNVATLDKCGQIYMKSDDGWSFVNNAVTSQFDEFKRLAKESKELNSKIDDIIRNDNIDYKFIPYIDEKFKLGRLHVLDPFDVTQEDIDTTKAIIDKLELLSHGYKQGKQEFYKAGWFSGLGKLRNLISQSELKPKLKSKFEYYIDTVYRGYINE